MSFGKVMIDQHWRRLRVYITLKEFSTYLATLSSNIDGLTVDKSLKKNNQNQNRCRSTKDIVFFIPIILPCHNLLPTLPTVQFSGVLRECQAEMSRVLQRSGDPTSFDLSDFTQLPLGPQKA